MLENQTIKELLEEFEYSILAKAAGVAPAAARYTTKEVKAVLLAKFKELEEYKFMCEGLEK